MDVSSTSATFDHRITEFWQCAEFYRVRPVSGFSTMCHCSHTISVEWLSLLVRTVKLVIGYHKIYQRLWSHDQLKLSQPSIYNHTIQGHPQLHITLICSRLCNCRLFDFINETTTEPILPLIISKSKGLWNTSRYPDLDILDLQNWWQNNSNNLITQTIL